MKMPNLPEKLSKIIEKAGLTPKEATWDCHGTPVVYHKALEKIATDNNIVFDPPTIISHNVTTKEVVICVTGHMADVTAWSFGEAAPYNNKNIYPFAMAEKRAKDRVILKLVGVHGDAYSQEEGDDLNLAQYENQLTGQLGKDYFNWKRKIQKFKERGKHEDQLKWEYRANEFLTEWRDSLKNFVEKATEDETFPTILIENLRNIYKGKKEELRL